MSHYFADSDSSGKIIGFYVDDIHELEQIPVTAINITEEQWQDCLAEQGKWIVLDGALTLDLVNYPKPFINVPIPLTAEQKRIAELETQNAQIILTLVTNNLL